MPAVVLPAWRVWVQGMRKPQRVPRTAPVITSVAKWLPLARRRAAVVMAMAYEPP